MSNPFTRPTAISGYNSTPPSDDGQQTTSNQVSWAKHKTKLTDPIKTFVEALEENVNTAFATVDDASNLTQGELDDARLSSNVPLKDTANDYTDVQQGPDGTAAAPTWSFTSDVDTGLYLAATGTLGITAGGTVRAQFSGTEIDLTATTLDFNGNIDADGTTISLTGGSAVATLSGTEIDLTATTLDLNGTADISVSLTTPVLRLTSTTDVSLASTGHAFQVGLSTGENIVMDTNEIIARDNGAASELGIQREGGNVRLGHGTALTEFEVNATTLDFNGAADFSGAITAAGDITAFSDIRLKKDLEPIRGALAKIRQLNGYTFTRLDTDERGAGVIAQEVEGVLPEVVKTNGEGIKSVAYGNLVALLIEAIKELDRS